MSEFRYLLSDSSGGKPLAELPCSNVSFSRVLSGCGQFVGDIPLTHPAATEAKLVGDREVTVLEDDEPVWNGPVTNQNPQRSSDTFTITADEASWYFRKRTIEVDKHYNADQFDIVRSVWNLITTKTSTSGDGTGGAGQNINAAIPRFSIASGTSGVTKEILVLGASGRHTMQDVIDKLNEDPDTGFEYRMDYATGSNRQNCQRTLIIGSPLGQTVSYQLTEKVLVDFGRTLDWERGGTRAHAIGAGYTSTKQNASSIAAGTILTEVVIDRSDLSLKSEIDNAARELRRRAQPPVRTFSVTYIPGAGLPAGFCDLGDTVPFEIGFPSMLSFTSDSRRVVQIDTVPASGDSPTLVTLSFNLPLDQLGT